MKECYNPKCAIFTYIDKRGGYCDVDEMYREIMGHEEKLVSTVLKMMTAGELMAYPVEDKIYVTRPFKFNVIAVAMEKYNKMNGKNEVRQ